MAETLSLCCRREDTPMIGINDLPPARLFQLALLRLTLMPWGSSCFHRRRQHHFISFESWRNRAALQIPLGLHKTCCDRLLIPTLILCEDPRSENRGFA